MVSIRNLNKISIKANSQNKNTKNHSYAFTTNPIESEMYFVKLADGHIFERLNQKANDKP